MSSPNNPYLEKPHGPLNMKIGFGDPDVVAPVEWIKMKRAEEKSPAFVAPTFLDEPLAFSRPDSRVIDQQPCLFFGVIRKQLPQFVIKSAVRFEAALARMAHLTTMNPALSQDLGNPSELCQAVHLRP